MGILNATPDSFSDGGEYLNINRATDRIGRMLEEGADIIDVGGESTRPGSDPVSLQEEMDRVLPILEKAIPMYSDALFSIDTTKYEVAKAALDTGTHIVNDVSGLRKEPRFSSLCAESGAGYVLMHSSAAPKTMQLNPEYKNDDVTGELIRFFEEGIHTLESDGNDAIIIDPGIGFGKTLAHNCTIVAELQKFSKFGYPVLMGASRKSMIGGLLNDRPVDGRLAGTLAVHYHSLMNGANILRVHDVQEAADSISVFTALTNR
ncbi:dihydropteroate synthase [Rhodohalobacter mucosus]|uniref:dihydropteroate synthase n=2 Tax=Rhodohalobacter mucosus TaxID=2079485 RepID=A0A316TQR4_9BACT|nr:dihydropteroate synthase [Rhodohalobacter mucosus]